MIHKKSVWIAISFGICLPVMAAEISSQEIIQKVEQKLNEQKTVKAHFEETYLWKLTGEKQSITGEFVLKGENRFRITTEDQVIVSDGETLWTYNKPTRRVLIDKLEKADNDWLPQKLFMKAQKEYRHRMAGEEAVQGQNCYLVEFSAEKEDMYITKMKVWVGKESWIPVKIEQTDISKNRTVYLLSEIQTGEPIEDSIFQFRAPESAEVIDLR
jgi:chaperone LolA